MSKFCTACGAVLDDNATFCVSCGAQQAAPAAPAAPVYAAPSAPEAPAPKKSNKGLMIGLIVGGVAIVVAILVFFLFFNSKPTDPLDRTIQIYNGDFNKIKDAAPPEYWDYYEDEYNETVDEYIQSMEESYDEFMEETEDNLGGNIKFSYKVTKEKELSEKKLEKIAEALEDAYDLDASKVTKGVELECDLTVTGDDEDFEMEDIELTVIQYNGKWYAIRYHEFGDELIAYFSILAYDF